MNSKIPEQGHSAYLLAQVGAHAAALFAQRLVELNLIPAEAGILRILRIVSGISQQELAARLQIHPSRLVSLLDKLERDKLIERKPNQQDRRLYSLHLTEGGLALLERVGLIARQHQQSMTVGLSKVENETLTALLQRIANSQGLTPGVHPGYRRLHDQKPDGDFVVTVSKPDDSRPQAATRPAKKARSRPF